MDENIKAALVDLLRSTAVTLETFSVSARAYVALDKQPELETLARRANYLSRDILKTITIL